MVVCLIHVGVLGSLQLVPQIQKELVVDNGVDVLGKLYKGRKLIRFTFTLMLSFVAWTLIACTRNSCSHVLNTNYAVGSSKTLGLATSFRRHD